MSQSCDSRRSIRRSISLLFVLNCYSSVNLVLISIRNPVNRFRIFLCQSVQILTGLCEDARLRDSGHVWQGQNSKKWFLRAYWTIQLNFIPFLVCTIFLSGAHALLSLMVKLTVALYVTATGVCVFTFKNQVAMSDFGQSSGGHLNFTLVCIHLLQCL